MQKILLTGLIALTPMLAFADTSTGTTTPPPRPPMGSGSEVSPELRGLQMAIGQLSPLDREALNQIIRDYLNTKGIDITKFAPKREEIKEIKQETRNTIQAIKKEKQQTIRIKRIEMRDKIRDIRQGSGSGSTR